MTPDTFTKLTNLLHKEEGYRQFPYLDTKGKLTVGIGMNLDSGKYSKEDVARYKSVGISLQEALSELSQEVHFLDIQLAKNGVYNQLDDVRKAVLVDMVYNMGLMKVYGFSNMWKALHDKEYVQAANEMLWNDKAKTIKTQYYKDVKKRAENLARMMQTGEW